MRHTSGTRFVVFVAAMSSTALLAAIQGCSSSSSSTPPAVEAGSSGSSGSSGDPPPTPDPPPAPPPAPPPTDGGTDAKKDATGDGGDGGAGLDDTGTIGACATGCTTQCTTVTANFKKGVAKEAIAGFTTATCGANTAEVSDTTIGKACTDGTAAAYCATLVAEGCNAGAFPNFAAQCAALAKALSGTGTTGADVTAGRKAFRDCLQTDATHDCTTCQDLVKGKP